MTASDGPNTAFPAQSQQRNETKVTDADLPEYTCARDYHLFGPGKKRILSLDGGGVRGAISLAFLERMEEIFSQHQRGLLLERLAATHGGDPEDRHAAEARKTISQHTVRLADWFDLIGGTSTGAVIAGAIALGRSTAEIKDFYLKLAPRVFKYSLWRMAIAQLMRAKFDARPLREEIAKIVEDRTLASDDIVTGLCIITKRIDTGSPWILSNDPLAPYWNSQQGHKHLPNRDYKLSTLVRASTAAPHYFDPEPIPMSEQSQEKAASEFSKLAANPATSFIVPKLRAVWGLISPRGATGDTHGLFIDGGVTPYNNPSMALMMLAVLKPYRICWPLGPDNLTFVSVGAGSHRTKLSFRQLSYHRALGLAYKALLSMMGDAESLTLAQMQWLGECPDPWEINREIKTLAEAIPAGHRWFRFMRYDLRLEREWLKTHLDLDLTEAEVARFCNMDDPGIIERIYGLARLAADKQVKEEHFFPKEKTPSSAARQSQA